LFFFSFSSVFLSLEASSGSECVCLARKPVVTEIRQCQDMVQPAILDSLPLRQQQRKNKEIELKKKEEGN
jgi:hypothetical protein